jgi:hypothetical protein
MRELALAALHPRRPAAEVPALRQRLKTWDRSWRALLRRRAAAFAHPAAHTHADDRHSGRAWHGLAHALRPVRAALDRRPGPRDWLLVLRLFLQDYYGAPRLRVTVLRKGQRQTVAEGCLKPAALIPGRTGGHYDICVPFTHSGRPDGVELEAWGYGGQGVAFLELQNPSVTLKPAGVRRVTGPVSNPTAVLRDDSSVALLGHADILAQMHAPRLAERHATIELRMASG